MICFQDNVSLTYIRISVVFCCCYTRISYLDLLIFYLSASCDGCHVTQIWNSINTIKHILASLNNELDVTLMQKANMVTENSGFFKNCS